MIWGGLSPDLLSKIATYPELCREAERVLESMYCASLPREVHVRDLVDKELRQYCNSCKEFGKRTPTKAKAMSVTPCPLNDRVNFLEFSDMCICRSGIHTHCMTCYKPPKGITGCRLCRPAGLVETTGPVELVDITPSQEINKNKQTKPSKQDIVYNVVPEAEISPPAHDQTIVSADDESDDESQISTPDSRLIVWEIKRPIIPGLPLPHINSQKAKEGEEEKKTDESHDCCNTDTENDCEECQLERQWYMDELEKAMVGGRRENDATSESSILLEENSPPTATTTTLFPPPSTMMQFTMGP